MVKEHLFSMFSSSTWLCGREIKEICCIGAGFVGGSTGAVLASQLDDVNVTVVDINTARIQAWNSSILPISEPGLDELVDLGRGLKRVATLQDCRQLPDIILPVTDGHDIAKSKEHDGIIANLNFTTDVDDSVRKADLIFVCVDTPSTTEDGLLGRALDTRALHKAVSRAGEVAVKDFIMVEKCTVPCGTAQKIQGILQGTVREGVHFEVLSNPEFLAEGSAVQDLLHPSRVLIGSSQTQTGMNAALALASVYERWVPRERILTIDTWSSELSKLAANALLAQRISSINSLSMICESMNADIRTVSKTCALDERIGPHMLNASVGFGGSCFHKDVSYLVYLAASLGLHHVARYWQAVLDMNEHQQIRFSDRVARKLCNLKPHESRIAVLGFAFKAKTNDTRNSAAIQVVRDLLVKGFEIAIYDPCVEDADILSALSGTSGGPPEHVSVCDSSLEACTGACAVLILTEWDGFRHPSTIRRVDSATAMDRNWPPTPDSLEDCEVHTYEKVVEGSPFDLDDLRDDNNSWKSGVARKSSNEIKSEIPRRQGTDIAYASTEQPRLTMKRTEEHTQWEEVARVMLDPKQIFDGRNIISDDIVHLGFRIERIGKMSSIDQAMTT